MHINIRKLTGMGNAIKLVVEASDTISLVKMKYQEAEGSPPEQQRLIFGGKDLKDESTVSGCNIVDGSLLHMVLRLKGG